MEANWETNLDNIANIEAKSGELAELLEHLRCVSYAAHSARVHVELDRAGHLLAWLIQQDQVSHPIRALRDAGWLLYVQAEIHTELTCCYKALYTSRNTFSDTQVIAILSKTALQVMDLAQILELEKPITPMEIGAAIRP